jgi:signal transduction histidine kinase
MAVLELESRRLRKVNEELDVFLYRSAHDLRAPLMGVKGVLSLMDMSQESNQTELEHLVVQEIDKADHVIREIVTLRQSQKKSLTISYLNLKDIIVRVIEDLNQKMVVSKSIQFDVMLDHLSSFYSDKERLYDVLYRLISNAVIYHDLTRENPKITIDFRVLKGKVMLSIADNGQGMDAKYLPYIFDMFYRVSKDSKGPGLGLYLAKEMMSQLQGTINVESERSVGTTMKVLLKDLKDATHA